MRGCSVQRWSLTLGHWAGIHVRIHIFLVLFAVLSLAYMPADLYRPAILTLAVALVSLALHEAAHALAALRVGGKVDTVILGPVAGWCRRACRMNPRCSSLWRWPGRSCI